MSGKEQRQEVPRDDLSGSSASVFHHRDSTDTRLLCCLFGWVLWHRRCPGFFVRHLLEL